MGIESPNSMTIAVTGAAGYIGSRVVNIIQDEYPEYDYIAIDNFHHGDVKQIGEVEVKDIDIRNRNQLEDVLSGADIVMHLAAISDVDECEQNKDLAYEVNVLGTSNVAWFCRKFGAGLIFPFSMAVLGNPDSFPITVNQERDPINWYARTKLLGENLIQQLADGAFPAHLYLKSNIYGEHSIDGEIISKSTVINYFVNQVFTGEPLTVYEPGTQSRNFVHVNDVARIYVRSAERLINQLKNNTTGIERYEVASDEDPSVVEVAELIQDVANEVLGQAPDVELVRNPRSSESLVSEFKVSTERTKRVLNWQTRHTVEESVRQLLKNRAN